MADIAHPAGLIAAGVMGSPLPWADVVTTTTHKTLRGPRGGMILTRDADLAKKIDRSTFPGAQGGPLMHQIAGKAVAFHEAATPEFVAYQEKLPANAVHLANKLAEKGLEPVTGGTECHLVLVDLRSRNVSGAEIEAAGLAAGTSLNKNMIPGDPRPPRETSGIRVGTAAVTTRGIGLGEMDAIAEILVGMVEGKAPESFRGKVAELCEAFGLPG